MLFSFHHRFWEIWITTKRKWVGVTVLDIILHNSVEQGQSDFFAAELYSIHCRVLKYITNLTASHWPTNLCLLHYSVRRTCIGEPKGRFRVVWHYCSQAAARFPHPLPSADVYLSIPRLHTYLLIPTGTVWCSTVAPKPRVA